MDQRLCFIIVVILDIIFSGIFAFLLILVGIIVVLRKCKKRDWLRITRPSEIIQGYDVPDGGPVRNQFPSANYLVRNTDTLPALYGSIEVIYNI
jgi:hypothetical protein